MRCAVRARTRPGGSPSSATNASPDSTISPISASSRRLVVVDVRGWRHLVLEGQPLLLEERQIGGCRGADVHGA